MGFNIVVMQVVDCGVIGFFFFFFFSKEIQLFKLRTEDVGAISLSLSLPQSANESNCNSGEWNGYVQKCN